MTRPDDPRTAAARVFAEGGAFGELLAGIDWAATPLGPTVFLAGAPGGHAAPHAHL